MGWVIAAIVFLAAIGFLAWKQGGGYAAGIAIFLILMAVAYSLVRRHDGETGALAFSLIVLVFALGTTWLRREK
jgi:hypothetical protein